MIQANLVQKDRALAAIGGSLQLFLKRELMYNPSRHELTPKHVKLAPEDVAAVKELYMLPHIHRSDVMAKWLGLRQGDVVRITRYNETSGEYYYYRYCV
jgi:DNA-directed RNA polymerase I, II, and III subunit RPABC1